MYGIVGQGKAIRVFQISIHTWLVKVESWFCFVDKCLSGCLSLRPAVGTVEISQNCPAVSSAVPREANSLPGTPEKAKERDFQGRLTQAQDLFSGYVFP